MQPGDTFSALSVPRLIAYDDRQTAKTGISTTETGVFRMDNVPVIEDHLYEIKVSNINMDGDTANQIALVRLRYVLDTVPGTQATTSSTQKNSLRQTLPDATNSNVVPWVNYFYAPSDGFLSLLWSMQKQGAPSGNIQWFCSGTDVAEFTVIDLGKATDVITGTSL